MHCFKTQRLKIRQVREADHQPLKSVLGDAEVMRYSTVGVHDDQQIDAFIANCRQQYMDQGFGPWVIEDAGGRVVGLCGINRHEVEGQWMLHINYRLATAAQGKGIASEAVAGLLQYAREELVLEELHALVDINNKASLKVVQKAGFAYVNEADFRGFPVSVYQRALHA